MHSNTWTSLTKKQGSYSAGALPPFCTSVSAPPNYVRSLFFGSDPGRTSVAWTEVGGALLGTHFYTFQAQETQDVPLAIPPEAIARLYCHAMVSMIPDEALPDLVDNLRDLELQLLKPKEQV